MRKILSMLFIVCLAVLLSACGGHSTKVFEAEEEGFVVKISFKYKSDKVIEQTTENTLPYDVLGIPSKVEAEEFFGGFAKQFEGIEGITHEMTYNDDEVSEYLLINYDKVSYDEVKDLPGMLFEGDFEDGVSMERTEKLLKDQGFEEVK